MAAIGWAALFVFFTSIMSLGYAGYAQSPVTAWVLVGIAVVSALVVMWAFGALDRRNTRKAPRKRAPRQAPSLYFERQQALSTLDRRDGVGNRKASQ